MAADPLVELLAACARRDRAAFERLYRLTSAKLFGTALKLAAVADQSLAEVPALAISLEPKGGSSTGAPTGPVLFTGPCVKYW